MAKLHFKYGAMNSGKTTILIQTAHNYEERDQKFIVIKPSVDTKGNKKIVSRIGAEREVDYLIDKDDIIINKIENDLDNLSCVLVDEVQFLTRKQVDELFYITKLYDIPVIGYGLRTDFKTNGFEGSMRMLELADELEEIPTICRCGKKARYNGRKLNGIFTSTGESIKIDGSDEKIEYESLCGKCYLTKVLKMKERWLNEK